jgi:hypothetical protein
MANAIAANIIDLIVRCFILNLLLCAAAETQSVRWRAYELSKRLYSAWTTL